MYIYKYIYIYIIYIYIYKYAYYIIYIIYIYIYIYFCHVLSIFGSNSVNEVHEIGPCCSSRIKARTWIRRRRTLSCLPSRPSKATSLSTRRMQRRRRHGAREAPKDFTKPQQTILSHNRLYKYPTDYTKPRKDFTKHRKDFTKPQQTILSHNRLYKYPTDYTKPRKDFTKPRQTSQSPRKLYKGMKY